MDIHSGIMNLRRNRLLIFLRRTILMSLLISLMWSLGFSHAPVLAAPNVAVTTLEEIASPVANSTTLKDTRLNALVSCLPEQLSEPNFKRSMSEMGNDQLERIFSRKSNSKMSPAEIELATCMNSKGFTR